MLIAHVTLENQSVIMTICSFPVMVFGWGPKMSMTMNLKSLQLERADTSACASLEIHFGHTRDIGVEVCKRHSPYGSKRSVVTSFRAYVSPWEVLLYLGTETSTRG